MTAAGWPRGDLIITRNELETFRERLLWGVAFSFLLHGVLLIAALTLVPRFASLLTGGRSGAPATTPEVLTFRFKDPTADVRPENRTEQRVGTPLLGPFASKARDRVADARDTPVPLGGQVADENSLPGNSGEAAGPPVASSSNAGAPEENAPAPDGAQTGFVAEARASEVTMLTGRRETRSPGRDGHGARRRADLGEGGALEFGDFAFSTTAWDYEPYWHEMRERLYANWHPPAAYKDYGIITGGWTLVRATLDRKGRIVHAEVLEHEGHESLHRSSLAAMEGAAPFRALPAGFPDESLTVTVKFIYLPPGERAPRRTP